MFIRSRPAANSPAIRSDIRHSDWPKCCCQPLFYAAKRLFGTYVNAVEQAGINYWEMSQEHLRRERALKTEASRDSAVLPETT